MKAAAKSTKIEVQAAPVSDDGKQQLLQISRRWRMLRVVVRSGIWSRRTPARTLCAPRLGLFSYVVSNATAARLATQRLTGREAGKLLSATGEINKRNSACSGAATTRRTAGIQLL